MEKNDARMVDVPDYARKNRNGSYYAMKRDMPYFENETGIRGYIVIGTPAEEAGKMYPNWAYDQYCTPECVIRKAEEEEARKKKEEEEARKAAEEAAEMERTLGGNRGDMGAG